MWGKAKPIPEGFHTLTPYLAVRDAKRAIDFYKQAFGAQIKSVHSTPNGKVINASLQIGDSMLMLNDESPDAAHCVSPETLGGSTVTIHIYVENADETFNRTIAAGATATMPMMDAFWGDRYGQVKDPFGHRWSVATHKEDLSDKEIEKRAKEMFAKMAAGH